MSPIVSQRMGMSETQTGESNATASTAKRRDRVTEAYEALTRAQGLVERLTDEERAEYDALMRAEEQRRSA